MTSGRVLQLNPKDNVLVALDDLRSGEQIGFSGRILTLRTDVPASLDGVRRLFLDTSGMMVRSARGTIGLSSRSFSAKTGTSRY